MDSGGRPEILETIRGESAPTGTLPVIRKARVLAREESGPFGQFGWYRRSAFYDFCPIEG